MKTILKFLKLHFLYTRIHDLLTFVVFKKKVFEIRCQFKLEIRKKIEYRNLYIGNGYKHEF